MLAIVLWFVIVSNAALGWKIAAILFYMVGYVWRVNVMTRIIKLEKGRC